MITDAVKIFLPATISFIIGFLIEPSISGFLYRHKFWKKSSVGKSLDGIDTPITSKLHNDEGRKTPRMGGIIVWGSAFLTILVIFLFSFFTTNADADKLSFLSRNQTWLPLFTLLVGAIVGLVDDYLVVSDKGQYVGGGLSLKKRIIVVLFLAIIGAWWFFFKLGVHSIIVPSFGEIQLGYMFIPLFIIFMIGIYSGGIIDGIDGLAGGVFAVIFSSYAIIAFHNHQVDLSAFCMVIVGSLLAFLWFNVPPARFYLSETGTMALTTTLVVVAFLTKAVAVLPIIAFPLVATSLSSVAQVLSKKFRNGKKIFHVAPLHHHFQVVGWPASKVTMRYWILSVLFAVIGIIITLI